MVNKLLNIFKSGKNSHQINLYYIWLEEIILSLEMTFPQKHNAKNLSFSPEEEVEIQIIMEEMLHKRIIRETTHESTEFASPIFIVKKPDGGTRLILNFKELNEFVKFEHFKMDGTKTIINMVTKNVSMATKDLKDAYHSAAINRLFLKFLKFKWKEKL